MPAPPPLLARQLRRETRTRRFLRRQTRIRRCMAMWSGWLAARRPSRCSRWNAPRPDKRSRLCT
jgi:hypothetical protein